MTTTLFIQILNMSLGAAWAALLVILARPLLRRCSHCYSYALWGVVFFRLVCPVSFSSVLSLMPRPQAIPQDIAYAAQPEIESGFAVIDQAVSSALSSVPAVAPPPVAAAPAVSAAVNPMQFWLEAGSLVWQAGMALLLLYGLASYLCFLGKLRGAVLVKDNIWESDRVPTAFVLGSIRPRIYLPTGLGETERNYVLCHEQTHIRRLDHIIKPVSLLLLTIHWFNPVLWLAWFLMRRDMEMSCDELALKKLGEENRKSYSACLLNLSARQSGLAAPLAFGENDVKGRIVNILRYKKPALWASALAVILAGALGFCLLANPGEGNGMVIPGPDPSEGNGITLTDLSGGSPDDVRNQPGPGAPEPEKGIDLAIYQSPDGPPAAALIHYTAPVRSSSQQTIHDNHLDYGVDLGTPVYSPIRGTVEEVSDHSAEPYGKTVVVHSSENPDVILTMAHLQTIAEGLKAGDPVDGDTQLGTAGKTGYATSPIVAVVAEKMIDGGQAAAIPVEQWDYLFAGWRDGISSGQPAAPTVIHYTAPVRSSSQQTIDSPNRLVYRVDFGTPIYSPIRGVVEEVTDYSVWPYGKTVVIQSSENPDILLMLAHLGTVAEGLKAGDPVDSDTQIGAAGSTGNADYNAARVVVREKTEGGEAASVPAEQWDTIFDNWRDGISGDPDPDPYTILSPISAAYPGGETWASPREIEKWLELFEAIYLYENKETPSERYGDDWPVAVMVETLSRYFEGVTAQDVISSGNYDPAADTIRRSGEKEALPPLLTSAVGWARVPGGSELFTVDYRQVYSYVGDPEDKAVYGRLTVKLLPDGSFRYLSNLESKAPGSP